MELPRQSCIYALRRPVPPMTDHHVSLAPALVCERVRGKRQCRLYVIRSADLRRRNDCVCYKATTLSHTLERSAIPYDCSSYRLPSSAVLTATIFCHSQHGRRQTPPGARRSRCLRFVPISSITGRRDNLRCVIWSHDIPSPVPARQKEDMVFYTIGSRRCLYVLRFR